jgi:kynureninase
MLHLLEEVLGSRIRLLTPRDPAQRGCQLSMYCEFPVKPVFELLEAQGVVCDIREPNVLRLAAVPLYNRFTDAHRFVKYLRRALEVVDKQ